MPAAFGIPWCDPKETYEAPAVMNGLWENNSFRIEKVEHLWLLILQIGVLALHAYARFISAFVSKLTRAESYYSKKFNIL